MTNSEDRRPGKKSRRFLFIGCLAVITLIFALVCLRALWSPVATEVLQVAALQSLSQGRLKAARQTAETLLNRNPLDCVALRVAALVAVAEQDDRRALEILQGLKSVSDFTAKKLDHQEFRKCLELAAEVAQRVGVAADTEQFLKLLLQVDSRNVTAANQLAYLFGLEGRGFEAAVPLFLTLKSGQFTPDHLVMLAAGEPVVNDTSLSSRFLEAVPADPLPLLGQARTALTNQEFDLARPLLDRLVEATPEHLEVQVQWGRWLLQRGTKQQFVRWYQALPPDRWHPDIWAVAGQWARQHHELPQAARCFGEALRRDPNHRIACYQLGQLLRELGREADAAVCLQRAATLEKLAYLVDRIYENPQTANLMLDAARLTESLGRLWEAWGWARVAVATDPQLREAAAMTARLEQTLRPETPRTVLDVRLSQLDLSALPLPDWELDSPADDTHSSSNSRAAIRFEDRAESLGMFFIYHNGRAANSESVRMLETIGGGVAVLDFDLDGWHDVHFPQAGPWQLEPWVSRPADQLFRNRSGKDGLDITELSRLDERGFSQGCTVGDYDGDGFPDLYIANIGRNRLFQNQGDGTFVDVTDQAGIAGERWTASCLLADLNGDGFPDLYDVNYLDYRDAPRALCVRGEEARTCSPGAFTAEPDELYLNLGDGRFEQVSEAAGVAIPNGKGLGIVAADFSGRGNLSLFVANDSVPNFFFINQAASGERFPRFSDQALAGGLALSHDGLSAAWMGIAAGDANGDGLLDLFSTTYADQAKSLFLQEPPGGQFRDAIAESGMNSATWKMLGFGTQFLDADLDGEQDLVLTNGHVFDLSQKNQPYEMPAQCFRNLGAARFREVPARECGTFFEQKRLGRGLARLDWDRDGRPDFVVSHMNSAAGLVLNRTLNAGSFLRLKIVGTSSSRDAIGTRVTVRCGPRQWTQQLTAGDGFEASNERQLLFGLGGAEKVDELRVEWLGGEPVVFRDLDVNQTWLIIQGQPRPWPLFAGTP